MSRLKWTVEFEVDEAWVAGGFELTDERTLNMLSNELPHAFGHELSAKVVRKPDPTRVKQVRSYNTSCLSTGHFSGY